MDDDARESSGGETTEPTARVEPGDSTQSQTGDDPDQGLIPSKPIPRHWLPVRVPKDPAALFTGRRYDD